MKILLCLVIAVLPIFGFGSYNNGNQKNAIAADVSNDSKNTIGIDTYIIDESEVDAFIDAFNKSGNATGTPIPLTYFKGAHGGHYVVSPNPLTNEDLLALGLVDENPSPTIRIDVSHVDVPDGSDKITCVALYSADKNEIEVPIEDGDIITVPRGYGIPGYNIIGGDGDPIRLAMPEKYQ